VEVLLNFYFVVVEGLVEVWKLSWLLEIFIIIGFSRLLEVFLVIINLSNCTTS